MAKDERSNAKTATPYAGEAQRKAQDLVKTLLAEIKEEPFPNERSLKHEDQEMKELERRLGKLLTPMDKLEKNQQKPKNSQKKTKRK